jgi:hypothetical protein
MGFRPAGNAFKPNTAGPFCDVFGRGGVLHFLAAAAVARPTPRRRFNHLFPWRFADLPVAVIQCDDRRIAERLGLPTRSRPLDAAIHLGYLFAILGYPSPPGHHLTILTGVQTKVRSMRSPPVPVEILNRTGQQCGVVSEKTKAHVATAAQKATLTIGFVTVIAGKGLAPAPLQFVMFKVTANAAARGLALRPF